MAIKSILGRPGAGKGVFAMGRIEDELVNGTRNIICTLPVRLQPWVRNGGDPMIGLLAYLKLTYKGNTFNAEKRCWILGEREGDLENMYLRRIVNGERITIPAERKKDKDGEGDHVESFDFEALTAAGPHVYVWDEAWCTFPARNWMGKKLKGFEFWARQHRHIGDDAWIVTHSPKDIDDIVRRVVQEWKLVRNHGKERLAVFRAPAVFTVRTFLDPPSPSATPMHSEVWTMPKKLVQCYDTSAGLGHSGGVSADSSERKKGWPWWWIPVGVAAGLVGCFFLFTAGSRWVGKTAFAGMVQTKGTNVLALVTPSPAVNVATTLGIPAGGPKLALPALTPPAGPVTADVEPLGLVGWSQGPGGLVVILSDGRKIRGKDRRIQGLTEDGVKFEGKWLAYVKPKREEDPKTSVGIQTGNSAPGSTAHNISPRRDSWHDQALQ